MKTNSEIRQDVCARLLGNWGGAVIFALVSGILVGAISSHNAANDNSYDAWDFMFTALNIFVGLPLGLGISASFLSFVRGSELKLENMFCAFSSPLYFRSVILGVLTAVYTSLWSLLLIVPGIIKVLSYSMAPYILLDNPDMSGEEAICASMKMMDGHKMDLFLIWLGYFGLVIVSAMLLFIPMLWLYPYYMSVFAKFYEELKAEHPAIVVE